MVVTNRFAVFIALLLSLTSVNAAVLKDDQADVLYHSYEGGGMKIDGPAVLIRKKATENVAFSAFYYVDTISSASVDVMSTASPYTEERKEGILGIEYLHDKTILSMNLRQSDESDYLSQSISLGVSHEVFGGLTTVGIGFGYGDDEITRNGDAEFEEEAEHISLSANIHQILTPNMFAAVNVQAMADEGFLNNPYRTVRFVDSSVPSGVGYQAEVYPNTRNSFAVKATAGYYLPYKAALFAHYRYFNDSWEIDSEDFELMYRQPFKGEIEIEAKIRYYRQTQAEFYSDLFPYQDAQNYLARDKELSDFDDLTIGLGVTYILPEQYSFMDWRSELSFQWDHIQFNYNNFRDPTAEGGVGNEALYEFSADVIRAFFTVYF